MAEIPDNFEPIPVQRIEQEPWKKNVITKGTPERKEEIQTTPPYGGQQAPGGELDRRSTEDLLVGGARNFVPNAAKMVLDMFHLLIPPEPKLETFSDEKTGKERKRWTGEFEKSNLRKAADAGVDLVRGGGEAAARTFSPQGAPSEREQLFMDKIGRPVGEMVRHPSTIPRKAAEYWNDEPASVPMYLSGMGMAGRGAAMAAGLPRTANAFGKLAKLDPFGYVGGKAENLLSRGVENVAAPAVGAVSGTGKTPLLEAMRDESGAVRGAMRSQDLNYKTILESVKDSAHKFNEEGWMDHTETYNRIMTGRRLANNNQFVRDEWGKMLDEKGIFRNRDNSLNFDRSQHRGDATFENDMVKMDKWVRYKGSYGPVEFTDKELDKFKRAFGGMITESATSEGVAIHMKNFLRDYISDRVPGYARLMETSSDAREAMGQIQKAFTLKDRASADTAIRKLSVALRDNNEFRQTLLRDLDASTGGSLMPTLAGYALQPGVPQSWLGRSMDAASILGSAFKHVLGAGAAYEGATIAHAGAAGSIGTVAAVVAMSSPRVMGEFFTLLGDVSRAYSKVGAKTPAASAIRQGTFQARGLEKAGKRKGKEEGGGSELDRIEVQQAPSQPRVRMEYPDESAPVEAREWGGDVRKGRRYVVGEDGPEMYIPNQESGRKLSQYSQNSREPFEAPFDIQASGTGTSASRNDRYGEGMLRRNVLHFQEGGFPPVGQPSMVGENGPEMFVPNQPGQIIPNPSTPNALGAPVDPREAELKAFQDRQRAAFQAQSQLPRGAERSGVRLRFDRGEEVNEMGRQQQRSPFQSPQLFLPGGSPTDPLGLFGGR